MRTSPIARARPTARATGGRSHAQQLFMPALAGVVVLVVLVGGVLMGLRLVRPGALPGTQLAGMSLGGASEREVASEVADYARRRERMPVHVRNGEAEVSAPAAELGYELHPLETVEAVLARGRQTNPLAALADHVRATFGATLSVDPVASVDTDALEAWVEDAAPQLAQEPVEATLSFDGGTVERVESEPGAKVAADELEARLRRALLDHGSHAGVRRQLVVTADAEPVEPETTAADLDAVATTAERAVSAPVTLTRDDVSMTLEPADIGAVLDVRRTSEDTDGRRLELTVDPDDLAGQVPDDVLARLQRDPVDAEISVQGGSVSISQSAEGFRFVPETAAEQVLELATTSGQRTAELRGEVVEPDLTTAEARDLDITERIATFTTNFTPGEPRVTNIQLIAEMVDGTLIRRGETFSLNGHVGPRTREKGFVADGAIFGGEFVQDIGGGVSQFATTLYNAAYFGGYAIPDHKAHSFYISRYPVGREATLDYPSVDLKIHNDSPHGALIKTSSTGSSVTVSMWGTEWVEVDSVAGERENVREPETEVRENPDLPPGERRVVRSGRAGFDITVTRVLRFPDGRVERETERTRYQAEPRVVEVGPSPEEEEQAEEEQAEEDPAEGSEAADPDAQD